MWSYVYNVVRISAEEVAAGEIDANYYSLVADSEQRRLIDPSSKPPVKRCSFIQYVRTMMHHIMLGPSKSLVQFSQKSRMLNLLWYLFTLTCWLCYPDSDIHVIHGYVNCMVLVQNEVFKGPYPCQSVESLT